MTKHDSDTPQEAHQEILELDIDGESIDELSPYSSLPLASRSVSFKPFTTSRAQRRTAAQDTKCERLSPYPEAENKSQINITNPTVDFAGTTTRGSQNGQVPDASDTDLEDLIESAKQKALASNKPKKAKRVEELYQRSLNDERLTSLLMTALRTNATPGQHSELQVYVDETKTPRGDSRNITPQIPELATTTTMAGFRARIDSGLAQAIDVEQKADPLTTFCALELWPRYCRLPTGHHTTAKFEAMTATKIDERGHSTPCHPVPDCWLQKILTQICDLLQAAEANKRAWIYQLMIVPGYKGQIAHTLLADEVRLTIHYGMHKYRQKRSEIGLLLECVGIERKGTFWKGPCLNAPP